MGLSGVATAYPRAEEERTVMKEPGSRHSLHSTRLSPMSTRWGQCDLDHYGMIRVFCGLLPLETEATQGPEKGSNTFLRCENDRGHRQESQEKDFKWTYKNVSPHVQTQTQV